jgi:murein DD-endopeptidase MepM/ murein hydrolase activator NlpD
MKGAFMITQSELINITKKVILSILTLVLIINININKVNAEVVDVFNENLSKYSTLHSGNFLDEIIEVITGRIAANKISFNNENIFYFSNESNFENIKEQVLKIYLKELDVREDLVLDFDIKGSFTIDKDRVYSNIICSDEEIAKKICDISKEEDSEIKLFIKYLQENDIEIIPSTVTIPTDKMFLGESKIIEGKVGEKIQVIEVTSENNFVKSTKIVKEDIAKEAISKRIYRGTKNPYEYGVAFLNQPTRGGDLTSGYGERWSSFHKGIDISGNIGEDVLVALDGEVVYAEYNYGGYGNLIIVEHEDDMKTFYGHLSDFYVNVGDKVKKGDIIGAIGSTGFSTGPHLHFELRVNNNPVDPYNYIIQ